MVEANLNTVNFNDPGQLAAALDRFLVDDSSRGSAQEMLAALRKKAPVIRSGVGVWVVTGLDAASMLLRDPRISRWEAAKTELGIDGAGNPELKTALTSAIEMMINRDEPDHTRLRRLVRMAFLPASIEAWRDKVRHVSASLVDKVIDKPEFDLLKEVAFPLPEIVICEMLGVPHTDHALWSQWSHDTVAANRTPAPTGENLRRTQEATLAFYRYFKELIAKRRTTLGDDLISTLLRAEAEGDKLSESELIGTVEMLIQAGHETTANFISNFMYHVLTRPEIYRSLCEDPERTTQAIEELLRLESPAQMTLPRMAIEDVTYGDVKITAGDKLLFILSAINRDPAAFENPDTTVINRPNLHQHIAFGVGIHVCLGRQLALLESNIMLREIFRRLPNLELSETPTWAASFTRGLKSLKVRHRKRS